MDEERNEGDKATRVDSGKHSDLPKPSAFAKRSASAKRGDLRYLRNLANQPGGPPSRGRESGIGVRLATRERDTSLLRVETTDKRTFEAFRIRFSQRGRLRPHWEIFALVVDAALERDAAWWRRRLAKWDGERAGAADSPQA